MLKQHTEHLQHIARLIRRGCPARSSSPASCPAPPPTASTSPSAASHPHAPQAARRRSNSSPTPASPTHAPSAPNSSASWKARPPPPPISPASTGGSARSTPTASRRPPQKFSLKPALIGLHGQTIHHETTPHPFLGAPVRSTWQIGEAAVLAERLHCPVVSDLRPADLAAGGQGAPLVPMLDYALFRHATRNRILLNLGGIANVTAIPAGASIIISARLRHRPRQHGHRRPDAVRIRQALRPQRRRSQLRVRSSAISSPHFGAILTSPPLHPNPAAANSSAQPSRNASNNSRLKPRPPTSSPPQPTSLRPPSSKPSPPSAFRISKTMHLARSQPTSSPPAAAHATPR